jgi:hypothetical protein
VLISASGESGTDRFTGLRDPQLFKQAILEQKARAMGGLAGSTQLVPDAAVLPLHQANRVSVALETVHLLSQLVGLRDVGGISAEEYESKKAEWLPRI